MMRATLAGPAWVAAAESVTTGATLLCPPVPGAVTLPALLSSTGMSSSLTVEQADTARATAKARNMRFFIQIPSDSFKLFISGKDPNPARGCHRPGLPDGP